MKKRFTLLALILGILPLPAATLQWTNTLGGNWFIAANWSPNLVPTVLDTASIVGSGTYTVLIPTGAVSVANLTLGGATGTQTLINGTANNLFITNSGVVSGNGVLTITNGGLQGQLTIQSGGQLHFAAGGNKNVYNLELVNQGTVLWSGGQLLGGSTLSTTISNGGSWQMTSDNQIYQTYGGPAMTWTNAGTIQKIGGTGISYLSDFTFVNKPSGVVSVTTGTLQFSGGTGSQLGGQFSATAPGIITITSGTWFDAGGTASGSGINRFNGGTLTLRTNIIAGLLLTGGEVYTVAPTFQQAGAITSLTLDGSQLKGTNTVGSGTLTINSGGVEGQLTVLPSGTLQFATAANKNVYNLVLLNQGNVAWNGGQLLGGSSSSTTISNGGLWQITGDNQIYQTYGGPAMSWNNFGTVQKSSGAGVSHLSDFTFLNAASGIVQALAGTLQFNGGANSQMGGLITSTAAGMVSIASGVWTDAGGSASGTGINRLNGGTLNLRTNIIPNLLLSGGDVYVVASTFQQSGSITNLTLDGSQLKGTNTIGSGSLVINAGGVEGQLTVLPPGNLQFATAANKNVYNLVLLNQGNVAWNGGQLLGGSSSSTTISNGGLWQITGDNQIYQTYGGPAMMWNNFGTLRKSAGAGVSHVSDFTILNQPGAIVEAITGVLQFNGGINSQLGGSFTSTPPGIVSIASGTWFDAGGSASITGTNRFNGGTLNLRTNIISNLRLTGGDVYILGNSTFQQAGAITNLTLDGSQLKGTNTIGNGSLVINAGGVEGHLTVLPPGTLQLATTANKNVYNLLLLNQGTVAWNGGQLLGGSSSSTTVSNGGLWQITSDNQIYQTYGGPVMTWTNVGTIQKSGGAGISYISDFRLANTGTGVIQVDVGTLQLPTSYTNTSGTLRLNGGTLQAGGTLYVAGGTLDGSGSLGANSFVGGALSPGQPGSGLIGFRSGLNLDAGTTVAFAGTGVTPGLQYDQLSVTGAVALANATLQVGSLPQVPAGTSFVLILNDGADAVSGTFNGLPENALANVSGQPFRIHYSGGTGNDVTLVRDSGAGAPQLAIGGYTNGIFTLRGVGGSSTVYTVQASTNFLQWINLGSATGDLSGNFIFNDPNASQFRYRFYRVAN